MKRLGDAPDNFGGLRKKRKKRKKSMNYLQIIEELEKRTKRPTSATWKISEGLSEKEKAIKAVLDCFPGATIVPDEEAKKMNIDNMFNPEEWAESQTREPGEDG